MVFSSLIFLCIFLPLTWILHQIVPGIRGKNIVLAVMSLLFYAYGEPVYVLILLVSAGLNYAFVLMLGRRDGKATGADRAILVVAVLVNIGILVVFKYTGMILSTLNTLTGLACPIPEIIMPIGISFFTFQALSYVIDVYRGTVLPQKHPGRVLLYIAFFPQLIAGPIVKYRDIEAEIMARHASAEAVAGGLRRFILGLGKKVILANTLGHMADAIWPEYAVNLGMFTWIGAGVFLLQLYYDFSGYSDMAIGLGQMFGFHFKENFLHPYGSCSMSEFWKRWHISLTSWFKEYLYIPLGGNRKGSVRTSINKFLVFLISGLWHGANWTFMIWGGIHGLMLVLEDAVPGLKKLPKIIGWIYVAIVNGIAFTFFRSASVSGACAAVAGMVTDFHVSREQLSMIVTQLSPWMIFVIITAILCMAPLPLLGKKLKNSVLQSAGTGRRRCAAVLRDVLVWILLVICMLQLSGAVYNPFIYFRF